MKMMLSVLGAERYLPMMRMGFGYVAMAVTISLTGCTALSSKEAVPEQYFCGSCIQ